MFLAQLTMVVHFFRLKERRTSKRRSSGLRVKSAVAEVESRGGGRASRRKPGVLAEGGLLKTGFGKLFGNRIRRRTRQVSAPRRVQGTVSLQVAEIFKPNPRHLLRRRLPVPQGKASLQVQRLCSRSSTGSTGQIEELC